MGLKINSNIDEAIKRIHRNSRAFSTVAVRHLAKEIKEDIYRDQDTQTGLVRQRKFDIGGVVAESGSLITGSRPEENPNIETAKLVDSIRGGKMNPMSKTGFVVAEASNGSYDYAAQINERNKFLQRGYLRQKGQLIELAKIIYSK